MRPPAIQAERSPPCATNPVRCSCFNEAACNTGGTRLGFRLGLGDGGIASMRPPAIQAERHIRSTASIPTTRCFNEAACNTGGTPEGHRPVHIRNLSRFNEAACNTGGTPRGFTCGCTCGGCFNEAACNTGGTRRFPLLPHRPQRRASMRPPAIQAERAAEADDPSLAPYVLQ